MGLGNPPMFKGIAISYYGLKRCDKRIKRNENN